MAIEPPLGKFGDLEGNRSNANEGEKSGVTHGRQEERLTAEKGLSEKIDAGSEGSIRNATDEVDLAENGVNLSQNRIVDGKEELVAKEGGSEKRIGNGSEKEKTSYAEVVNEGSGSNISPEFVIINGVADIEIPKEIFEDVEPLWNNFVVGYFMGDSPFIGSIHSTVNRIWSTLKSKIDVQFNSKQTVLFCIEDEQMRKRVLRRKYWHIADVPLVVSEWNPETAQDPPDMSAFP